MGIIYGAEDSTNIFNTPGLFRFISAEEQNFGVQIKGDYNYIDNKIHKGSIAFGTEFSHFSVDDVRYHLGYNFQMMSQDNPLIAQEGSGRENSYNAFLQLKHQWHSFILNAGLRYDHKERANNITLKELSPRVALILLQPKWNLKLSYSRSFVDAPYIYRKINELLPVLINGNEYLKYVNIDTLEPEFINSVQVTFAGLQWLRGLTFEINGFYNEAKNLIKTNVINHVNEGTNKTGGIEFMANYHNKRFTADFNLTWTHTFKSNVYTQDIDDNNNTPVIMSNAVVSWQASPRLKLHSHILFEGTQRTYNLDLVEIINLYQTMMDMDPNAIGEDEIEAMNNIIDKLVMNKRIPSRAIFNIGADYKVGKVTFGLNVRNIFDTYYYRSGMNTNVVPQKGRWYMFDVAYEF